MGWLKRKPDPLSDRAKDLNAQIAALEAQINQLASPKPEGQAPRLRSTVSPSSSNPTPVREPVFEEVNEPPLKTQPETASPGHFNELGVRKYDLPALLRRWLHFFHGRPSANPKLVNYLAAGSLQGLRPLRYEKRVARNRFLALVIVFILVLWGLIAFLARHR